MLFSASARARGELGRHGRAGRALAHTALVGIAASGLTMATVQVAQAATPPVFPDNIIVFPQRDFISIEGYQGHVGETVTVTVARGAVTTSTAQGTIAAGDPALEVNHPGGVCWQGVTPNIKPGDVVTLSFPDGTSDSTTTLAPEVRGMAKVGGQDLQVTGYYGNVPTDRVEQRIVAPDLRNTAVGRRDVRAPARPGPYTSTLTFDPGTRTFTANYHFNDNTSTPLVNEGTQMRNIAYAGQARALSWQFADAAGNRQGLTISEYLEVGGPGFGGCPTGPETMAPNAPSNVTATAGDASVTATWSAATTMPDAPAINGYRVTAVNAGGVATSVNTPAGASSATVPNLVNGQAYTVEVRALSVAGASAPGLAPNSVSPAAGGVIQPPTPGATAPNAPTSVTALPGQNGTGNGITATANWTAPDQPAGVTIDGWRVTAYDASSNARIKRVFVDEVASATAARSREVTFASGASVYFKVQAISADDAGTLSALSTQSNTVLAR